MTTSVLHITTGEGDRVPVSVSLTEWTVAQLIAECERIVQAPASSRLRLLHRGRLEHRRPKTPTS